MGYNSIMKVHKTYHQNSIAILCGAYPAPEKSWEDDKITCKNCIRIMNVRKRYDSSKVGPNPSPGRNPDSDKGQ